MAHAPNMLVALGLKPEKGSKSYEPDEDDEDSDMGGEAKLDAAKALISAVKSGDAEAVNKALERHYEACAHGGESDTDGED